MFRRNDPRETLSDNLLADWVLALRNIEGSCTIIVSLLFYSPFHLASEYIQRFSGALHIPSSL